MMLSDVLSHRGLLLVKSCHKSKDYAFFIISIMKIHEGQKVRKRFVEKGQREGQERSIRSEPCVLSVSFTVLGPSIFSIFH